MIIEPLEDAPLILTQEVEGGKAAGTYEVRMLKEGGRTWVTPEKVQALWLESRKHPVLFSDYTQGDAQAFLDVIGAPNSVWWEVFHVEQNKPVGLFYLSKIIPYFDAHGHFTFWDSVGRGREGLAMETLRHIFQRYDLPRVTAEVPVYQRGTIRFIERLGFTHEGERRNGVLYKDEWTNQALYGMLREEALQEVIEA